MTRRYAPEYRLSMSDENCALRTNENCALLDLWTCPALSGQLLLGRRPRELNEIARFGVDRRRPVRAARF